MGPGVDSLGKIDGYVALIAVLDAHKNKVGRQGLACIFLRCVLPKSCDRLLCDGKDTAVIADVLVCIVVSGFCNVDIDLVDADLGGLFRIPSENAGG